MSRRRRRPPPAEGPRRNLSDILYPTLDLHGLSEADAVQTGERWLASRAEEGEPAVRIITGRGLHSVGPAVLPGAVDAMLRKLKGGIVESYEREPGGGAYRVRLRLRRRPPEKTPRPPSQRETDQGHDAELRRRAEESLAELGIEPTPLLIAEEIRRMTT
jgi:hypothetical protein